jgi:hypothetical protein
VTARSFSFCRLMKSSAASALTCEFFDSPFCAVTLELGDEPFEIRALFRLQAAARGRSHPRRAPLSHAQAPDRGRP